MMENANREAERREDPILVTGLHRSGTSWVGKMLALNPRVSYISEPLNVRHRPGVMRASIQRWYTYICSDNEEQYLSALLETLGFQYHLYQEILSLRSIKDGLRMARDGSGFLMGMLFRRRPLLKDPFALFSSEWFSRKLNCQVLFTIRHPAGFVSSLKRLGWDFNFTDLLCQPLLLRDWLGPYTSDIEEINRHPEDILAQGSLLWCMAYQAVAQMMERNPNFIFVRHEDLSMDPTVQFQNLYGALGLEYSAGVERALESFTSASNPDERSKRRAHSVRLDSRGSLDNWKKRLTHAEIDRVRERTFGVYPYFYTEEDWE